MDKTFAKWARWQWSKGMGRWHRLFTDGDLTKTACQTPRKSSKHAAVETSATPAGGPVCPTCDLFDQLHQKLVNTSDAIATTTIEVALPVAAPVATGEPVLPEGLCACGCVKSDLWADWKRDHDAWVAAEHDRKVAAFEAFLAKGAVAA